MLTIFTGNQQLHCPGLWATTEWGMGKYEEPDMAGNPSNVDSRQEMEYSLSSLRSLVCDLLKANQELRYALLDAKTGVSRNQNGVPCSQNGVPCNQGRQ